MACPGEFFPRDIAFFDQFLIAAFPVYFHMINFAHG